MTRVLQTVQPVGTQHRSCKFRGGGGILSAQLSPARSMRDQKWAWWRGPWQEKSQVFQEKH